MIPRVSLRPARPEDAEAAAPLLRLTLGAAADLFVDRESTLTPEEILAALFARAGGRLSYQQGFVLEVAEAPAGLLVSFPASKMVMLDFATGRNLLSILGPPAMQRLTRRMLPMMGVHEAERGEYYLSNIAVLPEFQGRGCGGRLLAFAEERARRLGLGKCSLIVNQHNEKAVRFYQHFDYKIVCSGKFKGRLAETEGGYHRMVKEVS